MIFEVTSNQIERLDERQLIELLRRLIQAEFLKNGIALSSGTVPAQLNIPDGGEDGRVSWTGGINQTDWLPNRFTIFQCKKGKVTPDGLKAETQTKSSKGQKTKILNEALITAISHSGAYVVVTPTAVVGDKYTKRIEGIKKGISETGHDPSHLSSIDIYDCNKLTNWVNSHPSVALWINSLLRDVNLQGFQTYESWGNSQDISEIPFQQVNDARYLFRGIEARNYLKDQDIPNGQKMTFKEAQKNISQLLNDNILSLRVIAPSGFGKTRLVHQLFEENENTLTDVLKPYQVIYCDYETVKERLKHIALDLADSGSSIVLIVDDCPDSVHVDLSKYTSRINSNLKLITLGGETSTQGQAANLIIELKAASNELIDWIAKETDKNASESNALLIRELAQGYPRMAVYAAKSLVSGDRELTSIDTLVNRIVWGEREVDLSKLKSLQLLSFFTIVGMENEAINDLEELSSFIGKPAIELYAELQSFNARGVVVRHGDFGEVQPLPLAVRLMNQWLDTNPSGQLEALFRSLSESMKLKMLGRLRWISWSAKVITFGRKMLKEHFINEVEFDSEVKVKLFDRFVHLVPDQAMIHLDAIFKNKTAEELENFRNGRRNLIWALEKLAFRKQTFLSAARLLLRLAGAENEPWGNNATGEFVRLYQMYLSGTEAAPQLKLIIIDEGLNTSNKQTQQVCIKALDRMLYKGGFSRTGGCEYIGSGEALVDWQPKTYKDIYDYYLEALLRLEKIALDTTHDLNIDALNIIGSHLRGLFSISSLLDRVKKMIARLLVLYPNWYKPLLALNSWLYFNRNEVDKGYQPSLRAYYESLIPKDKLDQIYFYTSGWNSDLHDPDYPYDPEGELNHSFGQKRIIELIATLPKDADYYFSLIDRLVKDKTNLGCVAFVEISKHVLEPEKIICKLLNTIDYGFDINIIAGYANNVIDGATRQSRKQGILCLELVLKVEALQFNAAQNIMTVGIDNTLMETLIEFVKNDMILPGHVDNLGFVDLLNCVDQNQIKKLVELLLSKGSGGAWAVIHILAFALNKNNFDKIESKLLSCIKRAATNESLFEASNNNNMDWYAWHTLVELLFAKGIVSEKYALELLTFILSATKVEANEVESSFREYAQKILVDLTIRYPALVWDFYHQAINNNSYKQYRVEGIFGVGILGAFNTKILKHVPANIYESWMMEDKQSRLPFILGWLNLFKGDEDEATWDQEFVSFIDQYIDDVHQMNHLCSRLNSGIIRGSYAHKLEGNQQKLLKLKELVSNQFIQIWIDQTLDQLHEQILQERLKEENRQASYKA